jgi:hypothetical protein
MSECCIQAVESGNAIPVFYGKPQTLTFSTQISSGGGGVFKVSTAWSMNMSSGKVRDSGRPPKKIPQQGTGSAVANEKGSAKIFPGKCDLPHRFRGKDIRK